MGKFSKKAKRKAKVSRMRTEKMMTKAQARSGPVEVSYLPGFGPTSPTSDGLDPERLTRTKFPFRATINGREAIVSRGAYGIQFDYPTGGSDDPSDVQPEMPSGA